jgi:hypothetical protein
VDRPLDLARVLARDDLAVEADRITCSAVISSKPNEVAFIQIPRPRGARAETCPQINSSCPVAVRMRPPSATCSRSSCSVNARLLRDFIR